MKNNPPETSTTLLREIASDARNARWGEFVERYRPMMLAFLESHFPAADADDMVQETLIALASALPNYKYAPDEKGHFRNYLTGILRHKAIRSAQRQRRNTEELREFRKDPTGAAPTASADDDEEAEWRKSLMEVALSRLLADETIHGRTREVFRRVAVNGEKPDDVADSFGITRNAVDQMKNRMMTRLKSIVRDLERADG